MKKYNLYITQKLELKRDGNLLKIDDKKVPISVVKNLFVLSRAKISTSAVNLLLKNSRSIFYFNNRYELTGVLTPPTFKSDYRLRLKQYENSHSLALAKHIVLRKIESMEVYTNRSLQRYKEKLESVTTHNELLGVEGSASTYLFDTFRKKLQEQGISEFKTREYRPVKDRVNGVLSFFYTLYYSYLYGEVIAEGFDPYVGFLHIKRGTHAVFVSDMMEATRVELTQLAYETVVEHYEDGFEGLYLTYEARREALKRFDIFIVGYKNTLLEEIKEKLC